MSIITVLFQSPIFLKFSNFVIKSLKFQNSANTVPTLPLKSVTLCLARLSFLRSFLTSSKRSVLLCHPFVNSPLFCLLQVQNIHALHTNSKHINNANVTISYHYPKLHPCSKNFDIHPTHWTVNDVTGEDALKRS